MKKMIMLGMLCLFAFTQSYGQNENNKTVIHMAAGWNLVSVPRIQTDGNYQANHLFPGSYGAVFGYDECVGDYVEVSTLTVGPAYWVVYLSACDVTIEGEPTPALLVARCGGWQYLGSITQTVHRDSIQLSAGSIYGAMFKFDPGIGDYVETEFIEPGLGYTVYVTNQCVISLVAPQNLPRIVSQTNYFSSYEKDTVNYSFSPTDPNFVTSVTYTDPSGFADVSSSEGWTVYGNVQFGKLVSAEPALRIDAPVSGFTELRRLAGTGNILARVDFYADNNTSGYPHVLGFDSSNYRFCVLFDVGANKFMLQTNYNGTYNNPWQEQFALTVQRNTWYTVEVEKGSDGKCVAWVYERGESRNYLDTVAKAGYPINWNCQTLSAGDGNPFYLTNYYAGTYSQTTTYADGSGRTIQTQTRDGIDDIISNASYDNGGRQNKSCRAYKQNTGHCYDVNYVTHTKAYYNNLTNNPYSEVTYYPDPIGRVHLSKPSGSLTDNEWIETRYGSDTLNGTRYSYNEMVSRVGSNTEKITSRQYSDKLGRIIKTATFVGTSTTKDITTSTTYNMLGLPTKKYDPLGYVTTTTYDYLGRMVNQTTPDAGTSRYKYTISGKLRFMMDAVGYASPMQITLYWKYDKLGRVTEKGWLYHSWGDLEEHIEDQAFPSSGLAKWRKKYEYDNNEVSMYTKGRLCKVLTNDDDDAIAEVEETFVYDRDGNVLAVQMKEIDFSIYAYGTLYQYNHLGQLENVQYPQSPSAGNVMPVHYSYNQLGQVKAIGTTSDEDYYASYAYNADGKINQEKMNNGGVTKNYWYNHRRGYLTKDSVNSIYSETYDTLGYAGYSYYDGSIASIIYRYKAGGPQTYNYKFQYDEYNRMKVADNSISDANDLGVGSGVGAPVTYDKNGKVMTRKMGSASQTFNYYSERGRNWLKNINGTSADTVLKYDSTGNMIWNRYRSMHLTYDPFTMMTKKIVAGSTTDQFQYDGKKARVLKINGTTKTLYLRGTADYPIMEKTGASADRYYVYGPTGLVAVKDGGATSFVVKDHLGSTRVVLNSSNTPISWYDYTPYGKMWRSTTTTDVSYKFTGQEYDKEISLHNFRARMYDDSLNIFYATDPYKGNNQNVNPYSYVQSNPSNRKDPDGRFDLGWITDKADYEKVKQAIETAHVKIYETKDAKGNKIKSTFEHICELVGADTKEKQGDVKNQIDKMFTEGEGPKVIVESMTNKDGSTDMGNYGETTKDGNTIIINRNTEFFKMADAKPLPNEDGTNGRYNRALRKASDDAKEGLARTMEHEPIHSIMDKRNIEDDPDAYWSPEKDKPNGIQEKKYGTLYHMDRLRDKMMEHFR